MHRRKSLMIRVEEIMRESVVVPDSEDDTAATKPKFGELKRAVKGMRLDLQGAARLGKVDRDLGPKPSVGSVIKKAAPGTGLKTLANAGAAGAGSSLSRATPQVRAHLSDIIRRRGQPKI